MGLARRCQTVLNPVKYLAHLHALENEAKTAKRGGWVWWNPEVFGIIVKNLRDAGWNCGSMATTDGNG